MRGVSEFILILLILVIAIVSVSILWLVYLGLFRHVTLSEETSALGEALSSCMIIDSVSGNKTYLNNCGSGVVRKNKIEVYIDEEPVRFSMSPDYIREGEIATIELYNIENLELGNHKLKISSPSGKVERFVKATTEGGEIVLTLGELD